MKRGALLFGLIFAFSSSIQSQSTSSTTEIKADKYFAKREYSKAAKLYHKLADEVPTEHIRMKLARLYYDMGHKAKSYDYYKPLISKKYLTNSDDFLKYAELSGEMDQQQEAEYWASRYISIDPRNERAQNILFQIKSNQNQFEFNFTSNETLAQEVPTEGTLLKVNSATNSKVYVLNHNRVIEVMNSAVYRQSWLQQLLKENQIEITDTVSLNPVLFQTNQVISGESYKQELDKLARLMKKYKSIEFEISAHADASGTADYNLTLSQSRANAARDFLITREIQIWRLLAVGYGESAPLHRCQDRPCTDNELQLNRRMEFRLVYLPRNQIVSN